MDTPKTLHISPGSLRMQVIPGTINDEERTVEVVGTTEALVPRFDYRAWEPFDELLVHESGAVNMERVNSGGMAVLDNHRQWTKEDRLGVVESGRLEKGKMIYKLRFSKRASLDEFWQDVRDGIHNTWSGGYSVQEYEKVEREGQRNLYRATKWTPMEISTANIPADIQSMTRANTPEAEREIPKGAYTVQIRTITPEPIPAPPPTPEPQPEPPAPTHNRTEMTAEELAAKKAEKERIAKEAAQAERQRITDINTALTRAKLPEEFTNSLRTRALDEGMTADQVRVAIFEEITKEDKGADPAPNPVTVRTDEHDNLRTRAEAALCLRAGINTKDIKPEVKQAARPFRNGNLEAFARNFMAGEGFKVDEMGRREVFLAMTGQPVRNNFATRNATSDFADLFTSVQNRELSRAYMEKPPTFLLWCFQKNLPDFRTSDIIRTGGASDVVKVLEGGEYTYGTIGTEKETWQVFKYGKIISFNWEAFVNDDLSALNRLPTLMARSIRRNQSAIVYAILTANAAMGDGNALFHASHGNLGTPGAISNTTLDEAVKLMMEQKGITNAEGEATEHYLDLTPRFLLTGTAYHAAAQRQVRGQMVADSPSNENIYTDLLPIVDPRVAGNTWYLIADPSEIDTIAYGFLSGEPEIYTEQRTNYDKDTLDTKVRTTFGAKAVDWRGMVKNAGA